LASQRNGCRKVDPQRGHIVIAATARTYGAPRTEPDQNSTLGRSKRG